ncbi:MAG TPA: exonuclease subunit SbcD [Gemmataceae bacterium]|nr:exonuclease subunit SbcD [Gemmataceae bacterium]
MRIIHTADWHLCDWLRQVNRTDDLTARVEVVAELCEKHEVDALLIAGDLFAEQATVEDMTQALTHLHKTFATFFDRGGTILAVTGNHDREERIEMLRAGMRLAAPAAGSRQFVPGRMYLLNRPYFGTLQTPAGDRAQFVMIPYPTTSRYAEHDDQFRSKDEENRGLQGRVAQEMQIAGSHAEFDQTLPTILAAHLHIRGGEVHSLYKLIERDDVVFDAGFLPTAWAYIGLGHIHKPQCLGGMPHVRYPGSLDRLDFAERADEKGVVLLDVGPAGLQGEPVWIPIPATPMHDVTVSDAAAELPGLAGQYPDRETAIVRIRVTHHPAGPSRHEITQELRRLFPRHADITWIKPDAPACDSTTSGFKPQADYRTTIRDFLARELDGDSDKEDVLTLAEQFLTAAAAS